MANSIVAGNSTNGGTAITTDTSGTLNIVTGSGSGTTAITVDGSQNVTFANAITTTGNGTIGGSLSVTGNTTITGTLSASGGVTGSITRGTAVASTSGTSIDFTSIPSGVKRITVMFSGVSTNGTSRVQVQLGDSGGIEATGYSSVAGLVATATVGTSVTSSTGLLTDSMGGASNVRSGSLIISNLSSNTWVMQGSMSDLSNTIIGFTAGSKSLSDTLTQVRITTVNGTDTFDAGTINILYE